MAAAEMGQARGELEQGQRFESLGFTWCKIGSIALIAIFPKLALLLASALAIYFYARALMLGVNRSCCILRHPLLIIAFWMVVFGVTLGSMLLPLLSHARPGSGSPGPAAALPTALGLGR